MSLRELKNLDKKKFVLKNVNGDSLGIIHGRDIKLNLRLNGIFELSFTVDKDICSYYNQLVSYRRILVEDIGLFIIGKPEIYNDGIQEYKTITAKSFGFDINRKTIPLLSGTYKFYSINPEDETIMSIIMAYLPNWSIEEIDSSLLNIFRTFDLVDKPILDFCLNECQDAYKAVFKFNTLTKKISVKAYENIPKKSDIYLSYNNLVQNLTVTEKTDELHTALEVKGSNIDINLVNPLGNVIYNFQHFLDGDIMSEGLKTAIITWQNSVNTQQVVYANHLTTRRTKLSELTTLQTVLVELQSQIKALTIVRDALLESGQSAVSKNTEVKAKQVEINNKQTEINNKQAEINVIDNSLKSIQTSLSFENNFTPEQRLELDNYILQTSITDENFVTNDTDTELQKQNTAQDLYDKYKNLLIDSSKMRYDLSVNLIDFINISEYENFINQLEWGVQVNLKINDDGDMVYPMLLGLDIDWNDTIEIKYLFSTEVKLKDKIIDYDDFSNEVSNMSSKMASSSINWSQYVNSGDKDRIFDLFSKGLQADLTEIKNASNQNLVINELGLLARKQISENVYEDEQLKIMNNRLAITRDGWNSLSTVVGKVILPDGSIGFGVNAGDGILMGNLIAGSNLVIKNANNSFILDGLGATLKNSSLTIEKGLNKILLDPTNGFKIQNYVNSVWNDTVYLGTDGNLKVKGDILGGSMNINNKFIVDSQGNMKATSGEFTGTITASNFNQGTITGSSINVGDGNFTVNTSGHLVAKSGEFMGDISSSSIYSTNVFGSKIYGSNINSAYIQLGLGGVTNSGSLSLYKGGTYAPVFMIYDNNSTISLMAKNDTLLEFIRTNGSNTSVYGAWDFSNVTLITWGNNAPVGTFG